jgi:hypothetical protein
MRLEAEGIGMTWDELLPSILPFLPPFLGVLTAFLIERLWQNHVDGMDRQKFLQDVRKELEACSDSLNGEGNLVPTEIWQSGISSSL